jgi:phosphoribosylformylglycinamidine synthase subunit PurS
LSKTRSGLNDAQEGACKVIRYEIYVTSKAGIFDPAGEQAKLALLNLGYKKVGGVHIGKFIELDVEDGTSLDEVKEMCEKLLANPVIEDYEIKQTTAKVIA